MSCHQIVRFYLEGDWITLSNDDDVLFALRNEPSLYVEVFLEDVNLLQHAESVTNLHSKAEVYF